MTKYLKYLIFVFVLFLSPNVFAQDFNVSSSITSPSSSTQGRYSGLEIYNSGTQNVYSIGTRYNGQLSRIIFNLPLPSSMGQCFSTNVTYTVTMNMATDDWRNKFGSVSVKPYSSYSTNWSNGSVTYVNYKKIYFTFKIPTTETSCVDFVYIDLKSSNITSTAFTGVTNWNLSSVILTDPTYDSGSSGGSSGGGSGGSTNQDIIDSNTANTNNIINNNNSNTNNIIENNNSNTDTIVNSLNDNFNNCKPEKNLFNKDNVVVGYLENNGTIYDVTGYHTSDFIPVEPNTTYYKTYTGSPRFKFYNQKKQVLDTSSYQDISIGRDAGSFTTSRNTYFIRFTYNNEVNVDTIQIEKGNSFTGYSPFKETCTNRLDDNTKAINETNDYLKDDSDPNISDNEFTDLFNTVGFNDPLGYLLQLPVQFINQLVSQSNSCQTISLGTLWGVSLSLPCIDIGSIIGQQVWDIIDVLFSVGLLVVILKNLYQTFANLMTMGGEKEAREKFSMPTPMEFLSLILGGDR